MTTRPPTRANHLPRQNNLRRAIAAAAARLIAEEGVEDYGFAKRKAARQMGITEGEFLPTNTEIEEALQEHLAISAAVEAMHLLAPFKPMLTGTVLSGNAGAFSSVELEIYCDSAKDVEIFLLGQNLRYEHREVRRSGFDAPEAVLEFDYDGAPVRLSIFNHLAERSARRAIPGGTSERAGVAAVEALIGDER